MEFIPIVIPRSESELAVMVSLLEAHGIPYFVQNRGFGGLYPGIGLSLLNDRPIMVPEDYASQARQLLAVFDDAPPQT